MLGQYHASLHASGGITNASFFNTPTTATTNNAAANAAAPAVQGGANLSLQQFIGGAAAGSQDSVLSSFNNSGATANNNAPNPSVMANPAPGLDPNASVFNGMLPGTSMNPTFLPQNVANAYPGILGANNMQPAAGAMLQPPMANPAMLQGQGQMPNVMNPQQGQQQQAPYFVQPPMFMGPNGQPMFFRPRKCYSHETLLHIVSNC